MRGLSIQPLVYLLFSPATAVDAPDVCFNPTHMDGGEHVGEIEGHLNEIGAVEARVWRQARGDALAWRAIVVDTSAVPGCCALRLE